MPNRFLPLLCRMAVLAMSVVSQGTTHGSGSRSEDEAQADKGEHYHRLSICLAVRNVRPAIWVACARCVIPTLPVTPSELMTPGMGYSVHWVTV